MSNFKRFMVPATLYDAMALLQKHCEKQSTCEGCVFDASEEMSAPTHGTCMLTRNPIVADWADNLITRVNGSRKRR